MSAVECPICGKKHRPYTWASCGHGNCPGKPCQHDPWRRYTANDANNPPPPETRVRGGSRGWGTIGSNADLVVAGTPLLYAMAHLLPIEVEASAEDIAAHLAAYEEATS